MGTSAAAIAALKLAIATEQEGYRFYQEAASRTRDPRGRALFAALVQDEVAHEQMLQARLEALQRGEGGALPLPPSALGGAPIFPREGLAGQVHDYTYELSALRLAYLIEHDAVAFYTRAAEGAEDPDVRAMFAALAEMERGHERVLEEEYRFLAGQFRDEMGFAPF